MRTVSVFRLTAWVCLTAATSAGCAYRSEYLPTREDRAFIIEGPTRLIINRLEHPTVHMVRSFECTNEGLAQVTAPIDEEAQRKAFRKPLGLSEVPNRVIAVQVHRTVGDRLEPNGLLFVVREKGPAWTRRSVVDIQRLYNDVLVCERSLGVGTGGSP